MSSGSKKTSQYYSCPIGGGIAKIVGGLLSYLTYISLQHKQYLQDQLLLLESRVYAGQIFQIVKACSA